MAHYPDPKDFGNYSPDLTSSPESMVFVPDEPPNAIDVEGFYSACNLSEVEHKSKRITFPMDLLFKRNENLLLSNGSIAATNNELKEKSEDKTAYLPDECLAIIFQKLDESDVVNCTHVCKRWYRVEAESRSHLIAKANVEMTPIIPKLMNRYVAITKLVLKCDKNMFSIDNDALVAIATYCPFLRKLKLKNCKMITDIGMENFTLACPKLQKFSCVSCGFGARGLNFMLTHCKYLEDLTVKRSVKSSTEKIPEEICAGNGSLKRLCIKYQGSAHVWTPLIKGSNKLETLIIARNRGYWDAVFENSFSSPKPSLAQVYIEDIKVTDRGLTALASCGNLQALVVVQTLQCTHVGLSAIAAGCPSLRRLHVERWSSNQIADLGFKSIANHCKDLQELVIVGFNISAAGIFPLASKSTNLERLTICTSETLGDEEMACIAQGCINLKRLCIRSCPNLTDLGLLSLAKGCPNLQKIKIRRCSAVTRFSISVLSESRNGLTITYADRSIQDHLRRGERAERAADHAVEENANERGERWGFRTVEGLRELGREMSRNLRGNPGREADRVRNRERERGRERFREGRDHRGRERNGGEGGELVRERLGLGDAENERDRLRRALQYLDQQHRTQNDGNLGVVDNNTHNRLSRARMAFAAGTSYMALTLRRLVGGAHNPNPDDHLHRHP